MYDTYIYAERVISEQALTRAFAQATKSEPESIATIESPELDGAVDAWGDPDTTTVLRHWTIPGEFPFAVEIVFKQPDISSQQETLAILRQVAADLNTPLLSIAHDGFGAFRAIFPDGGEALVDEDGTVPDPAIALTPAGRQTFNARRAQTRTRMVAAN